MYDIFWNRDNSRRIGKWATKLFEYIVDFEKHGVIKSQILANFMADWTEPRSRADDNTQESLWLVYYDGA
jgi:hypothetical protein